MKILAKFVLSLTCALSMSTAHAAAATMIGNPTDVFYGCDPDLGFNCSIKLDERGNISAHTESLFGHTIVVEHIAPTVDPLFVDSTGAALQVTSYLVHVSLIPGAIGLCQFGVTADGSACTGPTGDDKSDVLIFTNLKADAGDAGLTRLDFLSDNEAVFRWLTDFNVLEVGTPEVLNGAVYDPTCSPRCEAIVYTIISDIPEPAPLTLAGIALAGLVLSRRRRV